MVGFIFPRSKSITVDGSMDVSTPSTIPIWELILGTLFRTLEGMISYAPLLALRQFRAKQFIPATNGLASLEITYDQSKKIQVLSQIMQAWKDPHRTRLGQLIEGCTSEYTIWRRQKIEDMVHPPARMRVSVSDFIPKQLSEVDIVRSEWN